MSILAENLEKKSNFWKCCRNLYPKVLPKFLATWWGPPTPEMSGDAVSDNSIDYSQSYMPLKFCQKCEKWTIFQRWEIPMNWYFKVCFKVHSFVSKQRQSKIHSLIRTYLKIIGTKYRNNMLYLNCLKPIFHSEPLCLQLQGCNKILIFKRSPPPKSPTLLQIVLGRHTLLLRCSYGAPSTKTFLR